MQFNFKAQSGGRTYEGVREATDKFALYRDLRKEGAVVISVSVIAPKGESFLLRMSHILSVSEQDKISFARNLGGMIAAGLTLSRALSVIVRQTKNKKLKGIVNSLDDSIKQGLPLSEALGRYPSVFSGLFVSMVHSGEESGNLGGALSTIALQLEKAHTLRKKVKGAMIYPAIIITVMIAVGVLMLVYVVPGLTSTFKELNVELPISTKIIIFTSDFLVNNILVSIISLFALAGGVYAAAKTKKGKRSIDFFTLHLPIIGRLVKETNTARTAQTLSSLLVAGVDIVVSLSITADVLSNTYYKDVLKKAEENIKKGEPLSKIFTESEKVFPSLIGEMISVGEETGKLSDMLGNTAIFYEEEVERKTKDLSTIIEPILMVFIGAVVGFFALAMITPIYSVMNTI